MQHLFGFSKIFGDSKIHISFFFKINKLSSQLFVGNPKRLACYKNFFYYQPAHNKGTEDKSTASRRIYADNILF